VGQSDIKAIEVLVECGDCEGGGVVYDPFGFGWEGLFKLSDDEYRKAMADRGYGIDGRQLDPSHGFAPPEEGPCPECNGTGERLQRMTLDELADELAGRGAIGRSLQAAFNAIGP
jgi:hypothetical protein